MIGKRFYTYSPIQNIPAEYTSTRAIFLKYSAGQFAGPVIFYLLEILTIGQFAGQLISFRILGASPRSGQLLKHSRVLATSTEFSTKPMGGTKYCISEL
jgi:hypothetical protein